MTLEIYRATRRFPREEAYGLTSQIRRSSSSIGANLAEGCGRESEADFGRFLVLAMGSASELENHLLLAKDLGFLSAAEHAAVEPMVIEVKRMLTSFIKRLRADG